MARSTISYQWRDKNASEGFRCGVSLHSHTNQSRETLDFLANLGNQYPWIACMGCASTTRPAIGRRR
jgi:hypothetical protein